jgi:hypothetical protein
VAVSIKELLAKRQCKTLPSYFLDMNPPDFNLPDNEVTSPRVTVSMERKHPMEMLLRA